MKMLQLVVPTVLLGKQDDRVQVRHQRKGAAAVPMAALCELKLPRVAATRKVSP
jgi:hypothetical protein